MSKQMTTSYQPPFTITPEIISLVADIAESLGKLAVVQKGAHSLRLRRANRIKTIHASLAIEGNTLNEKQITAILEGKLVLAPQREIQEVKGALSAYEQLETWQPTCVDDLLKAHTLLMDGLLETAGVFRTGGAGIMKGKQIIHLAPPADRVPVLIKDLLTWLKESKDHPLIKSSVFHYEFEFIHPFSDGNGRMGRLWQTLILTQWNPLFSYIPVETIIHDHQNEYYQAINQSSVEANSSVFIAFMLRMLSTAIRDAGKMSEKVSEKVSEKMSEKILRLIRQNLQITIAELALEIGVSTRTIERHLKKLQDENRLERLGSARGGTWHVTEREE